MNMRAVLMAPPPPPPSNATRFSTAGSCRITSLTCNGALAHGLKRNRLIGLQLAGDGADVLLREKSLGDDRV